MALSVTVSIVANQYAKAVLKIWEQASIDRGTAHAQLHKAGFFDDPDSLKVETTFEDGDALLSSLNRDPEVEGVSRRLLLEGVISAHGKTVYFLGKAINSPTETLVSPQLFTPSIRNGIFISEKSPEKIVLGRGLADALDLKIGDEANLMVSTVHGAVNGLDVTIGGIIHLPIAVLSKRLLYMDLSAAQKAVEMPKRFNELAIRLKPGIDPRIWVKEQPAHQLHHDLELRGWWDIDKIIVKAQELIQSVIAKRHEFGGSWCNDFDHLVTKSTIPPRTSGGIHLTSLSIDALGLLLVYPISFAVLYYSAQRNHDLI